MKLLVCIVPQSMVESVTEIIGEGKLDYQIGFPVEGTAPSGILEFFSLYPTDRQMVLSLVDKNDLPLIFERFKKELHFLDRGSGVAFTVPLSRIAKSDYQRLYSLAKEDLQHGK